MKLFATFLFLTFLKTPPEPVLMIDMQLKKPVSQTANFTLAYFFQKNFPVYGADRTALLQATDAAAKRINEGTGCETADTVKARHSTILILTRCGAWKTVSVLLKTKIEDSGAEYCFVLVKNEGNMRLAQRRLMDFSTYLSR